MQAETPNAVDFVLVTFASGQLSNAYSSAKCTRTYAVASERFVLDIAAALYHGREPSTRTTAAYDDLPIAGAVKRRAA